MTIGYFRQVVLAASLGVLGVGCGSDPVEFSRSPIRVNEVSSLNDVYQDLFGNAGDWIELYNTANSAFDLEGCYISDSANKRFKDQFPAGYSVPAHGVLLMFADAQPSESSESELHLSFKLSSTGEGVWLSSPDGYVIDSVQFSQVPPTDTGSSWISLARIPDGTGDFQWCPVGTPDERNGERCAGQVF